MSLPNEIADAKSRAERIEQLSPLQKAALAIKELRARLDHVEGAAREPVAIVGMGCRFPQADGLDAYWRLLAEGRDAIREVPIERWDLEQLFDPNPNAAGRISTRYGGFLNDVDHFDAGFFGISSSEAEYLDPQQRMLLEVAWHALEDAGQAPSELKGSRTGVFVGITQTDYGVMQLGGQREQIEAYTGTGNGLCFAAGRLAYVLGVHGPTFSVDTACSSSMVALHQACLALRQGECDVAIVAGVQLNLTPPMQIFLSKTQSFSPDGRCRTFDEAANGFVLGEGAGVIVLRRLSDATARGDLVRALIRASGLNHDGPASGLTVPSQQAQECLIREVVTRAGLSPADIDYVEAHGTATQLGDPIEVGALKAVFGQRPVDQPLHLGSVKTNFGHLNAAAGVAGLIKSVLMLEHEQIVPNLHFKQASSRIDWEGFTVRVPSQLQAWPRRAVPRRSGVSSFGLSGTNTHTVLEEAPLVQPERSGASRASHLLCLSARSEQALREVVRAYLEAPLMQDATALADLCWSANGGRNHFAWRVALPVGDKQSLREQLQAVLNGERVASQVARNGPGRLAWCFADTVDVEAVHAVALSQPFLAAQLTRYEAFVKHEGFEPSLQPQLAQLACQLALADLWNDWGLRPAAVSGAGVGALAALRVAGVFDTEQVFALLGGQALDGQPPALALYLDATPWPFVACQGYRWPSQCPGADAPVLNAAGFGTLLHVQLSAQQPWDDLLGSLAGLYLRGFGVDWARFDAGYAARRVRLPLYPFQRQRYWLPSTEAPPASPPVGAVPTTRCVPAAASPLLQAPVLPTAPAVPGMAGLLASQLESAAASIQQVVAQQLAFLQQRMQSSPASVASPEVKAQDATRLGDWQLLQMAANTQDELALLVQRLAEQTAPPLHGVQGQGPVRAFIVHRGGEDLALALGRGGAPRDPKRFITATAPAEPRQVAFMFPGVGDHYLRMAQGLYASAPVFRDTFDWCCKELKAQHGLDLASVLYPAPDSAAQAGAEQAAPAKPNLRAMLSRSPATQSPQEVALNRTEHCQPLLFIVAYALGRLWLSQGVKPKAMIGYSVGEYAAACLSGVISPQDALHLIARRAQLIAGLPTGVLLAVPLSEARLRPWMGAELSLSIVSTPTLCVVGGPEAAVAALEAQLKAADVVSRRLPGTHAFHSHMLEPLHGELVALVAGFQLNAPRIPFVSNLSGRWITEAQARDPDYWARHTWQTVRFADGLAQMFEGQSSVFLEVGPGQSLGSFVHQHPMAERMPERLTLNSLKNRYEQQPDEVCFLTTLGKLWLAGVELNFTDPDFATRNDI